MFFFFFLGASLSLCLGGKSVSPSGRSPDLHQVDVMGVEPAVDGLAADPQPPGQGGDIAPFRQQEFLQLSPARAGRDVLDPGDESRPA